MSNINYTLEAAEEIYAALGKRIKELKKLEELKHQDQLSFDNTYTGSTTVAGLLRVASAAAQAAADPALKVQIDGLRKQVQAEAAKKWPQHSGVYWYVTATGYILREPFYTDDAVDQQNLLNGNCFRTYEEALQEQEARKVMQELRNCEGRQPFKLNSSNYYIYFDYISNRLKYYNDSIMLLANNCLYFDTAASCGAAVDKVGKSRVIAAIKWLASR